MCEINRGMPHGHPRLAIGHQQLHVELCEHSYRKWKKAKQKMIYLFSNLSQPLSSLSLLSQGKEAFKSSTAFPMDAPSMAL